MSYLYGDSSEANLDFNYLAFLREAIDCAATLLECETAIATANVHKRARESEAANLIAAVDDLGRRTTELVAPVAKEQAATPVGRCAAALVTAIREAVEREAAVVKSGLASDRAEIDADDLRIRTRARDVLEKLLRAHDLPDAESELDIVWSGTAVTATMRQRTKFGVEAVLALEVPGGSLFAPDLRVERVVEGVELHAHEQGGWLKKSDKLVALKLGRYHVVGLTVADDVRVRLRASNDASAATLVVTAHRSGEVTALPGGGAGHERELVVEDRDKQGLRLLAARLEAAAEALGEKRTGLVLVEIDGVSITDHDHPRVLAERLVQAMAPTVKQIARHSRSPGELVLRRLLGDNRREEIFVTTGDLMKRIAALPPEARAVFGPLELIVPAADVPTFSAPEPVRRRNPTAPLPPATRAPSVPPIDEDSEPPPQD